MTYALLHLIFIKAIVMIIVLQVHSLILLIYAKYVLITVKPALIQLSVHRVNIHMCSKTMNVSINAHLDIRK